MTENISLQARELVRDCINAELAEGSELTIDDVSLVWFCKTLQNWKALVITTRPEPMYYEVTHNGDLGETYVDIYIKTDQIIAIETPLRMGELK